MGPCTLGSWKRVGDRRPHEPPPRTGLAPRKWNEKPRGRMRRPGFVEGGVRQFQMTGFHRRFVGAAPPIGVVPSVAFAPAALSAPVQ